jgi:signal transduction histidine kinase
VDPFHSLELAYALEEATAKMRHDVRNKLSGMENMVFYVTKQVMKTELPAKNPVVAAFLTGLDDGVRAADGLLDELTATTHPFCAPDRAKAVSALSCVEQAVKTRRVANGSIPIDVRAEPADIFVDPASMAVALRALVENAVESSPAGGRVAVSGRSAPEGYLFEVADRGPGIADPEEVMTPFFSTKEGHLGLGLGIARRILLAHDGSLSISGGSEGTTVTLVVPRAPPADQP